MHPSALQFGKLFFETYCSSLQGAVVHDVGAQNVNGSLKDVLPPHLQYVGVDFVAGNGVDIILEDPYKLPFADESLDILVCSSCFEHSQFFWLVFLEMLRVLKPQGLLYLNVPSNGSVHGYPVDCWRFYPDAGKALEAWAARNGYSTQLTESFIGERSPHSYESGGAWHDFVAVFVKEARHVAAYPARILDALQDYQNGYDSRTGQVTRAEFLSPDHAELVTREQTIALLGQQRAAAEERLVLLSRANEQAEHRAEELFREVQAAQAQLQEVLRSKSWRLTAPIRRTTLAAKAMQARLRSLATRLRSRDLAVIRASGQFDEAFYRAQNPDLGADSDVIGHYCAHGWREGRDPSPRFSTRYYLDTNPDVRKAGANPFFHYITAGMREGRSAAPGNDVRLEKEIDDIRRSGKFDEAYYLATNLDLEPQPSDPIRHYCEQGWREGRNPSDEFDTRGYLAAYRDIREAAMNPFWHYVTTGITEFREAHPGASMVFEDDVRFGPIHADIRLLAFYAEPDWSKTRGAGVTGTREALVPHRHLGFYDPVDPGVLKAQAALARRHGIQGFCFRVYVNASGGTVVPPALAALLGAREVELPFCVQLDFAGPVPAAWNGGVLSECFRDRRSIRIEGRSVLLVRLGGDAGQAQGQLSHVREALSAAGAGPVFLTACWTDGAVEPLAAAHAAGACDAIVDLPVPSSAREIGDYPWDDRQGVKALPYSVVASRGVLRAREASTWPCPLYQTISVGREDGDAEAGAPFVYTRFGLPHYRRWLDAALDAARTIPAPHQRFVFLRSWNDWNTGQVLEPDRRGGYGRLNETSRALLGIAARLPTPKVTVIVPNYNHEPYLRRRLDSIYSQTYRNIEVVLMDDCSSDGSRSIMQQYADAYPEITRTLFNEANSGGVFRQWGKGLQAARGDLVWIAESDDYCDERFLEVLVRSFDDEAVMLAYGHCAFVRKDGTPMADEFRIYLSDLDSPARWNGPYKETAHREVSVALGIKNTIPNASGVVFRRPVDMPLLEQPWWQSMKVAGDWVFYLHVMRGGRIAFDPAAVNYFRRYEGSTAEVTYKKETFYREVGMACREVAGLYNVPRAVLERCRDGYWKFYEKMIGGNRDEFDRWFDFDAVLSARSARLPNVMVSTMGFMPGGAEIFPIRLANELKRQGVPVLLLSSGLNVREDGVRRLLRNDVPVVETSDVARVKAVIEEFGVEVLNTHQWHVQKYPSELPDVFAGLRGHVATLHGMIEHGHAFGVTEEQLQAADRNVSTWVYTADKNLVPFRERRMVPADGKRFVKMANGIQTPEIEPVSRARMNIPEEAFVLCCVSRAIPDKGWAEAIAAVERARELSGRDIRLVLVGNGSVYEAYRRTGVPPFVHLAGFSENSAGYYAAADMGIMLTWFRSESFPLTIVDCLFAGKPYIATDVGEIPNMLAAPEGTAGEIIPLQDWKVPVETTARAIAAFATDDAKYRAAKALVPKIVGRFRIETVASLYVDLFLQCSRRSEDAPASRPVVRIPEEAQE